MIINHYYEYNTIKKNGGSLNGLLFSHNLPVTIITTVIKNN